MDAEIAAKEIRGGKHFGAGELAAISNALLEMFMGMVGSRMLLGESQHLMTSYAPDLSLSFIGTLLSAVMWIVCLILLRGVCIVDTFGSEHLFQHILSK